MRVEESSELRNRRHPRADFTNSATKLLDVSVVVPIKGSPETVRKLTTALLQQRYMGNIQIIYVGDFDDSAWTPLKSEIQNGKIEIIEVQVDTPRRDANAKRSIGLRYSKGAVIAMTDGDFVPRHDWIAHGLDRIHEGYSVVGGPMFGTDSGFWSVYTDSNPIGPKTPRINGCHVITKENFGKSGRTPPITANLFFTREVYEVVGGPPLQFTTCFEDYPWFRAMVDRGYTILMDETLVGFHFHRGGFLTMSRDYYRSGYGCADYVVTHPKCRFGLKRASQVLATVGAELATVVSLFLHPVLTTLTLAALLGLLDAITVARQITQTKQRALTCLIYPVITALLGSAFSFGFLYRFFRRGWRAPVASSVRLERRLKPDGTVGQTIPLSAMSSVVDNIGHH
jgi:hypothetical protein